MRGFPPHDWGTRLVSHHSSQLRPPPHALSGANPWDCWFHQHLGPKPTHGVSSWAHFLTVGPNAQNNCHNLFFDLKESGTAPIHTVSLHENLSRCHWSESPKKDLMVIWSAGSRSEASSLPNTNMLSRSVDSGPQVCLL